MFESLFYHSCQGENENLGAAHSVDIRRQTRIEAPCPTLPSGLVAASIHKDAHQIRMYTGNPSVRLTGTPHHYGDNHHNQLGKRGPRFDANEAWFQILEGTYIPGHLALPQSKAGAILTSRKSH